VASRNLTMLSRAICGSRGQLLRRPSARHFRVADPAAAQARLHLECAPMAEAVVERAEVLVYTAGVYCGESALLRDVARAIRTDSLILKVRAQEVRRARRIFGGSAADTWEITSLIRGMALCTTCIGFKIGAPRNRVDATLKEIGRTLALRTAVARCQACLTQTIVYALK